MDSTIDTVKISLRRELEQKTYGELASRLGISKGALWKFVNTAYIPTDPLLRRKLGMPELMVVPYFRNSKGRFSRHG